MFCSTPALSFKISLAGPSPDSNRARFLLVPWGWQLRRPQTTSFVASPYRSVAIIGGLSKDSRFFLCPIKIPAEWFHAESSAVDSFISLRSSATVFLDDIVCRSLLSLPEDWWQCSRTSPVHARSTVFSEDSVWWCLLSQPGYRWQCSLTNLSMCLSSTSGYRRQPSLTTLFERVSYPHKVIDDSTLKDSISRSLISSMDIGDSPQFLRATLLVDHPIV